MAYKHNVYKSNNNKKLLNPKNRLHWLNLKQIPQKWYYIGFLISYLLLQQTEVKYKDHKFSVNFFHKETKTDNLTSIPFLNPLLLSSRNKQAKRIKNKNKPINLERINEKLTDNTDIIKHSIENLPILPDWNKDNLIINTNNYSISVEDLSIFSQNLPELDTLIDIIQPIDVSEKRKVYKKTTKEKKKLNNTTKVPQACPQIMMLDPIQESDLEWDLISFKGNLLQGYNTNKLQIAERTRFNTFLPDKTEESNTLLSWDETGSSSIPNIVENNRIKEIIHQLKTCQRILNSQIKLQNSAQKELIAKSIEHVDLAASKTFNMPTIPLYEKQWNVVSDLLYLLSNSSMLKRGTFGKIMVSKFDKVENLSEDEIAKLRDEDARYVRKRLNIRLNSADRTEALRKSNFDRLKGFWTKRFIFKKRIRKYERANNIKRISKRNGMRGIARHSSKQITPYTFILDAYQSSVDKLLSLIIQGALPVMDLRMTDSVKAGVHLNPDSVTQFNLKLIDIIKENIEILIEFDLLSQNSDKIDDQNKTINEGNLSFQNILNESFLHEKKILQDPIHSNIHTHKIKENFYNLRVLISEARSFLISAPEEHSIVEFDKGYNPPFSNFPEGDQIRISPTNSEAVKIYSKAKDYFQQLDDSVIESDLLKDFNPGGKGPISTTKGKVENFDIDTINLRLQWINFSKERDKQIKHAFRRVRKTRGYVKRLYDRARAAEEKLIAAAKKKYQAEQKKKRQEEENRKRIKEERKQEAEKRRLEKELEELTPKQRKERKEKEERERREKEKQQRDDEKRKKEEERQSKIEAKQKKREEEKALSPQEKQQRRQEEKRKRDEEKKNEKQRKEAEKKAERDAKRKKEREEERDFRAWLSDEDRNAIDNANKLTKSMEHQFMRFDINKRDFKESDKAIKIFRQTQKRFSEHLLSNLTHVYTLEKYMQSLKQMSQTQNNWGFLEMYNDFRKLQLRTEVYNIAKHGNISMIGPLNFQPKYEQHSPFAGAKYDEKITSKEEIKLITKRSLTAEQQKERDEKLNRKRLARKKLAARSKRKTDDNTNVTSSIKPKRGAKKYLFYPTAGLSRNGFEERAEARLKGHYAEDCSRSKMYYTNKTSNWINHRLEKTFARLRQQATNVKFLLENRKRMIIESHINEILVPGSTAYSIQSLLINEAKLTDNEKARLEKFESQCINIRLRGSNILNFSSIGNIALENNIFTLITRKMEGETTPQQTRVETGLLSQYDEKRHWTLDPPLGALDYGHKERLRDNKRLNECWKPFLRRHKPQTIGHPFNFYERTSLDFVNSGFLNPFNNSNRSQNEYLHPIYEDRLKTAYSMKSSKTNRDANRYEDFDLILKRKRRLRKLKQFLPLPRIVFRARRKPMRDIITFDRFANPREKYKKTLFFPAISQQVYDFRRNILSSSIVYDDIRYDKKLKDSQDIMLANLHLQNLAINDYYKIYTQLVDGKGNGVGESYLKKFNQYVSLRLESYFSTESIANSLINSMRKSKRKPQAHVKMFNKDNNINRFSKLLYIFTKMGKRDWDIETTDLTKYAKRLSNNSLTENLSPYDNVTPRLTRYPPYIVPEYLGHHKSTSLTDMYYHGRLPGDEDVMMDIEIRYYLSDHNTLWWVEQPILHHSQLFWVLRHRNSRLLNIESLLAKFKSNLEGRAFNDDNDDELLPFNMPHRMERLAEYMDFKGLLNTKIEYGPDLEKDVDCCLDTIELWLLANIQDENYTRSYLHGKDYLKRDQSAKILLENKTEYGQNIRKRKFENLTKTLMLADSCGWPNWILSRINNSKHEALLNTQAVEADALHRVEFEDDLEESRNATKRYKTKNLNKDNMGIRTNKQRKIISEERFDNYPYNLPLPFEETDAHIGVGKAFDSAVFAPQQKNTSFTKKRLKTHSGVLQKIAFKHPIQKFTSRKMKRLFRFFGNVKGIPVNKKLKPDTKIEMGYLNPDSQYVADSFDVENLMLNAYGHANIVQNLPDPISVNLGDKDYSPFKTYLRLILENNVDFRIPKTPEYGPSFGGPAVEMLNTTLLPSVIDEHLTNVPGFLGSPKLLTRGDKFFHNSEYLQKWRPFYDNVDPSDFKVPELEQYYLQPRVISFLKNKNYQNIGNSISSKETRFTDSLDEFKRDCLTSTGISEERKETLDNLIDINVSQPNKTLTYFHDLAYLPEGEQARDSKFLSMERPQTGKSPRIIWVGPGATTHDQFILISIFISYIIYFFLLSVDAIFGYPPFEIRRGFLSGMIFKAKLPNIPYQSGLFESELFFQNWIKKRITLLDIYITRTPKMNPTFQGEIYNYSESIRKFKNVLDIHETFFEFSHNPKVWYNSQFAKKYFSLFGLGSPLSAQLWIQTIFLNSNLNLINIDMYNLYTRRSKVISKTKYTLDPATRSTMPKLERPGFFYRLFIDFITNKRRNKIYPVEKFDRLIRIAKKYRPGFFVLHGIDRLVLSHQAFDRKRRKLKYWIGGVYGTFGLVENKDVDIIRFEEEVIRTVCNLVESLENFQDLAVCLPLPDTTRIDYRLSLPRRFTFNYMLEDDLQLLAKDEYHEFGNKPIIDPNVPIIDFLHLSSDPHVFKKYHNHAFTNFNDDSNTFRPNQNELVNNNIIMPTFEKILNFEDQSIVYPLLYQVRDFASPLEYSNGYIHDYIFTTMFNKFEVSGRYRFQRRKLVSYNFLENWAKISGVKKRSIFEYDVNWEPSQPFVLISAIKNDRKVDNMNKRRISQIRFYLNVYRYVTLLAIIESRKAKKIAENK